MFLLAYVVLMLALATVALSSHLNYVLQLFVDNRNFPGGPLAYDMKFYSARVNIAGDVWCVRFALEGHTDGAKHASYFILNWMADGLLVRASLSPMRTSE
jgi:hypothetical protein